jgi:hypothetical protein
MASGLDGAGPKQVDDEPEDDQSDTGNADPYQDAGLPVMAGGTSREETEARSRQSGIESLGRLSGRGVSCRCVGFLFLVLFLVVLIFGEGGGFVSHRSIPPTTRLARRGR